MIESSAAFLSLVELLQKNIPANFSPKLLEPFPCSVVQNGQLSVVGVQKAGKIIAQHAGLSDLTFVVTITKLPRNTAGHIELDHRSPEVFIEISDDICWSSEAVLATLCHEIAHKFLHKWGIRNGHTALENEYLTDVATVFLGLGKLMLNGCESSTVITAANKTTTHSLRVGYVSKECLAFVYLLVCTKSRIARDSYEQGLNHAARQNVTNCCAELQEWFDPDLSTPDGFVRVLDELRERVIDCQEQAANFERDMRILRARLSELDNSLGEVHNRFRMVSRDVESFQPDASSSPLRYLSVLSLRAKLLPLIDSNGAAISSLRYIARDLTSLPRPALSQSANESFAVIHCPLDRTKLRLPNGRRKLIVKCATCGYKFVATTSESPAHKGTTRQHYTWWKRLRGVTKPVELIGRRA